MRRARDGGGRPISPRAHAAGTGATHGTAGSGPETAPSAAPLAAEASLSSETLSAAEPIPPCDMFRVRPAASGDIEAIRRIEVAAGEMFRGIGMDEIADDDPPTRGEIARAIESRGAWAAVDAADRPVGYLVASRLQGSLHVDQVTVHPDAARRGIGRRLISAADACAEAEGTGALTLTTFARVPWNAPYYRRLGFSEMGADGLPEDLAAVVAHEASLGLARWPRVVMRRECGAIRPPGRS